MDHKVAKCTGGPTGWPGYAVAYPKPALLSNNFFNSDLIKFKLQLDNYIDDIKHEDSFKGLTNLVDLSVKLVEMGGIRFMIRFIIFSNWSFTSTNGNDKC